MTTVCALVLMRPRAIFARIMTVFAKHEQAILMIIYIISEVGALVLRIANMLIHLEFLFG